ncbi:MAG: hypothetical protein AB8B87_05225 [Granulosicoccus sp.]
MIDTTQFALLSRVCRPLVVVVSVIISSACGTPGSSSSETGAWLPGVAVIGSAAKIGLKAPVNASRMSSDLAMLLGQRSDVTVTSLPALREIVGAAPHDEMMAFYARHGRFAPYQIQRLMAANLPASKAIAVRLEADTVERLPLLRENVLNSAGMVLADRERHTYTTRRVTRISATLLNLRNGRVIWTRQYRVSPETALSSDQLMGRSFSSSVAAAVANTLVNGLNETRYPEPVPLLDSVQVLLEEVAYNAPLR